MSKCDLRVELDDHGPFAPGDAVRGRVIVNTNADVRCDALTVRLGWHTHGSGNPASDDLDPETVFVGEWRAGEQASYPFALTAPNGPFTYRGRHLNVDWRVKARADIPWAIDPKASADFLLPPVRTATEPDRGTDMAHGSETARRMGVGCMMLFFLPFLLVGLATLFAWFGHQAGTVEVEGDAWVMLIVGPVFTLVGAIPLFVLGFRWLARRKVGDVDVQLSSGQVRRGEELRVKLRFEPRSDFMINEVVLRLLAQEEVVRGSGSNKTTYRHEAHVDRRVPIDAQACRPFDPVSCEVAFPIPDDAPPTFGAPSNRLHWELEARIDIPGWPDWTREFVVQVDP